MKLKRILALIIIVAAVLLVRASIIRIGPDEIGVRTINFGSGHGIVQEDYGPGYHRNVWLLDTWNRYPSSVQRLRFSKDALGSLARPVGELQLTSADGDRVSMTAEAVYRISDGAGHFVLQDSGAGKRYEDVVRNLAQDAARVLFGRLRTEAFYNEANRESARQEAAALLRERLKHRGIDLVDLLVETIEFDPNYENLIKQKKIADQQVELQKAKARAAAETGKVNTIKAETTVKVQKVEKETEAKVTQLRTETDLQVAALINEANKYATQRGADGTLYDNQKKAEGQRLVKFAQAEGTQRLNAAMIGEGGRNLVALEAAKALNLADVTFPSYGYDWFNPYQMALRLGGGEAPPAPAPDVHPPVAPGERLGAAHSNHDDAATLAQDGTNH
ncbi:MAG TPA: SPFH domain-containing protein [Phycisphaerae bacterium]